MRFVTSFNKDMMMMCKYSYFLIITNKGNKGVNVWTLLQCLCELVNEAPFLYTTELDNLASLCFRAMDSSNYDVRCDVAKLLGRLLAATQTPQAAQG